MSDEPLCLGCGRFVGAVGECRYCGEETRRYPLWRRLRVGAVLLAVCGLTLLYVAARHKPVPLVRACEVVPTMNFSYVRVEGRVCTKPYISRSGTHVDYASFSVDDGTGWFRVSAYGRVAARLEAQGRLPAKGEPVALCGSLGVRADGRVRLYLRSAGQLQVSE